MIEFWPDCCGYKVQVEDSEAGKWIRCPYCNARVQVPQKTADQDMLADAIAELPDDLATPAAIEISGPAFGKRAKGLDPLRVAITAGLIVVFTLVVTVVIRQAVWFFESRKTRLVQTAPRAPQRLSQTPAAPAEVNVLAQLPGDEMGLFVDSYPPELQVFVREIEGPLDRPELLSLDAMEPKGVTPIAVPLPPASYWVFVRARLNAPELMRLEGFPDLRRKLETTGQVEVAAEYFVVDGASRLEYRESSFGIGSLVKVYHVTIEQGNWTPLTCYLLPMGAPGELVDLLPDKHRYPLDEELALLEMDYRGVPPGERQAMLEMLRRAGKAMRREADSGLWRIFQITPHGLLSPAVQGIGVGEWEEPKRGR